MPFFFSRVTQMTEAMTRAKIRNTVRMFQKSWREICTNCESEEIDFIKAWDMIALRQQCDGYCYPYWVSCWVSGSYCQIRRCPGRNGPFPGGDDYWHCRGEKFWITNAKHKGVIKACELVAVQYSYQNNKGYWLSHAY